MQRVRKTIATSFVALFLLGVPATAYASGDAGDDQGYCKKQGPSGCSGQSECSTSHRENLPPGKQKRCN